MVKKQVAKFVQHEYSVRFLEVFDELIEKQLVENMKEFCKKMDYLPQSMSQVRKGKRDITLDLIIKLFYEYGGNPVYVLLGLGNEKIIDKNSIPTIPKKSVSLDGSAAEVKLVKTLEDLAQTRLDYIVMLKNEVERLKIQLGDKGK